MTKLDYLRHSIENKFHYDLEWLICILSILDKNSPNKYLEYRDKTWYVVNGEQPITDIVDNEPMFKITEPIKIDRTYISNLEKPIDTTVGRLLVNLILIERPFGNKIDYINNSTSVKHIESIVGSLMRKDIITIEEYLEFNRCVYFLTNLSSITNVSATMKSVLPPPNIEQLKIDTHKEFDNKYGKDWVKDRSYIAKYQEVLKKADDEWLKDDPSYGKLISGKIKNNTRVKMYLTFGGEVGFDKTSGKVEFVENSLLEQYPKDPTQLATMFNASRAGSYGRGHETQKGGAAAKDLLRTTSGMIIKDEDCGSNKGFNILVTAKNSKYLNGRYLLNGKVIENANDYIGQVITIRSTMFCKSKGEKFCKKCAGDILASSPNGVGLKLLDVSGALLTISLKGMHDTQVKLTDFNILEELH